MMEQRHYSVKFPVLSEFNVTFYLIFLCEVVVLAGLFVCFGSKLSGQLFFFSSAAFFLVAGSRIQLIKKYIIAKLQAALSENITLCEENKEYAHLLLKESNLVSEYQKREIRIRYTTLLLVFLLFIGSRAIHLHGVARFNLLWMLTVVGLTAISLTVAHNVMNYLKRLIDANYDRIAGHESFADSVTLDQMSAPIFERYLVKWKNLEIIFFALACLCSFVLLLLEKGVETVYTLSVLSATLLVLITLDLGKVIKPTMLALAQYDDFIKRKIGITFSAHGADRGSSEFSDELNKNLKDFFK